MKVLMDYVSSWANTECYEVRISFPIIGIISNNTSGNMMLIEKHKQAYIASRQVYEPSR